MDEVKTFGELTRDEQFALIAFWLDGGRVEAWRDGGWERIEYPSWHPSARFRVAATKPRIDWSHVAPEFRWLAQDANGYAYLYTARPVRVDQEWEPRRSQVSGVTAIISYEPGTCDWRDSLVQRPEGV